MELVLEMVRSYPAFADLVMIMGVFRIVFKPLFTLINTVILTTPTKKDDEQWAKIQGSKIFSTALFLIDYIASVKIPTKKS